MSPRWKGRLGLLALGLALAAGLGAWALEPVGLPCPFGVDPELPALTVCQRAATGLVRSLGVGVAAGLAASALALALAVLARWRRGLVEAAVTRAADVAFALPDVLVLVLIAFGARLWADARGALLPAAAVMAGALVAVGWAAPTRLIHRRLETLERADFVTAARALGASRWHVVTRHLLPFASEYLAAVVLLRVPAAVLAESTVSFLGFGLPPSEASLGTWLGGAVGAVLRGEWRAVGPAWALLLLLVAGFQWAGAWVLWRAAEGER